MDVGVIAASVPEDPRPEMGIGYGRSTSEICRRAWYLYELLTGNTLDVPDVPPTNNVLLLDPALHCDDGGDANPTAASDR